MPIPQIDFNKYIPGFSGLTSAASGNIGAQLGGLPSAGPAKTKAAYFGATSGMPNSGVSNALGYDLFQEDANKYQQQGMDNLIAMLTGYSGTVAPTTGQAQTSAEFDINRSDRLQREERARQEAAAAQSQLNRPRQGSGLYRTAGNPTYAGTSSLPVARNDWWR